MVANTNIIIFTAIFGISSLILLILAYKKVKEQLKRTKFLMITLIAGMNFFVIYIIVILLRGYYIEFGDFLRDIATLNFSLIFFPIYLYFESLLTLKPKFPRFVLYSGLFCFSVTTIFISLVNGGIYYNLTIFSTCFFIIFVGIFGVYVNLKNLKEYKLTIVKIELISMVLISIGGGIPFIFTSIALLGYLDPSLEEYRIIFNFANVWFAMAVILLLINGYLYGNFVFLLPNPIQAIMLYNKGGVLIYYKTFLKQDTPIFQKEKDLISGAFTAFSLFFQDILGANAKLSYIRTDKYEFLLSELREEAGTVIIVTSHANYLLKESLNRFCRDLPKSIIEKLDSGRLNPKLEGEINKNMFENFPYLLNE
jgi:hypothetical protein